MLHKTEVHLAVQVQCNPASGACNNPVAMPAGKTVARVRARARVRDSHALDLDALEHPRSRHHGVRCQVAPVREAAPWLILCYLLYFSRGLWALRSYILCNSNDANAELP